MMQRTVLSVIALVAALTGCATSTSAPSSSEGGGHEAQIRVRSTAFWEARQRNDVAAAYQFTSPSYREVNDQERFRVQYSGVPSVVGREIESIACDDPPLRCVVKQAFKVIPPMMQGVVTTVYSDETWILEEDEWWVFRP